MKLYWNIFWKTFAQLATGVMSAALLVDWSTDYKPGLTTVGLGLLAAGIGGVVAAGHAYYGTPAADAIGKATRSFIQFFVGGLGAIALNSVADFTTLPKLAVPLAAGAVLSFALTFFQYQGAVE